MICLSNCSGPSYRCHKFLMLRGAVALLMIAGLCQFYRAWTIRYTRKDWGLIALRCSADVCVTYFFLNALINMPIANATAILQLLLLTIALGAALFLHELLGWRRMIAIGIRFLGMLMIVCLGAEGFSNYSYYALIAVLNISLGARYPLHKRPYSQPYDYLFCCAQRFYLCINFNALCRMAASR